MGTVEEFYKLRDTEDFFNFFGIEFDQKLINVKRFHMMKEYGSLIKKGLDSISEENKLLEFLKFSLLRVYGDYKTGHSPSAAEVWNMYETGKLEGCSSCGSSSSSTGGSCGC
ncbi:MULTISPECIES: nitrogenase-stabilizing/protective protein NifW [Arcobacter]|jgi:nitrogenase-stabilizing/protective protein|uniref:Nitrogenase-stabilizing/protective protein NifW n=1 Tax=Arcobacter ellisii TaxID=913109 RepID=A0A347U4G2_9BACT|nr:MULTISPECIES: nitrogenase-stabilizing/protective protein NifW [Arcobacter]AXX93740.1 nitrogen fixation protein NifW [Arcobacter ellisii]MBD3829099.1 nitrogen fixation protein NifW [Arcobacter sp.]MDD3007348.1 nitrogenase-stabilizing/protective protein NifW [Arcobacter sp.]RXI32936.1 nitrogen fixation protein NifW [Arcobacter ellisii]